MHASKIRERSSVRTELNFIFPDFISYSLVFWHECLCGVLGSVQNSSGSRFQWLFGATAVWIWSHPVCDALFLLPRRQRNKVLKLLADQRRQWQFTYWLLWTPFHQMRSTIRMPFVPLENNHVCNAINVLYAPRKSMGFCHNFFDRSWTASNVHRTGR